MEKLIFQILILIFLFPLNLYAAVDDSSEKVEWGYKNGKGPSFWGSLDPQFRQCSEGKSQSPIDIPKNIKPINNGLTINYQPAGMYIVDDGDTDLTIGNQQTIIHDGHAIQLNFHEDLSKESITLNGNQYRLVQFHFHTPSETTWHHAGYPLEMHFVHQGGGGKVAVIGVLIKGGAKNVALQKIIEHLPKDKAIEHNISGELINPANLMPAKRSYYQYNGSLTTPPCTEGLQWMVMATSITASPAQIMEIRKATGGSNARSVQPLNGRMVYYSGH